MKRAFGACVAGVLVPLAWLACGLDVVGAASGDDAFDAATTEGDTGRPGDGERSDVGDAGVRGAPSACPSLPGPAMVRVGTYCIDSTEVTQSQYSRFLSTARVFDGGAACAYKTDFQPNQTVSCRWEPGANPNLPVTCVDWCDAVVYCRWAGKRLCGAIDGGAIKWARGDDADPTKDQWYQACSKGGALAYPYGSAFDAGACNGRELNVLKVLDAGSLPGCNGGYSGLFDMVGNAFEWEDSCEAETSPFDHCKNRGGSWYWTDDPYNSCAGAGMGDARNQRFADVGFRCCTP
jgi:formylglycine-generating enzyme